MAQIAMQFLKAITLSLTLILTSCAPLPQPPQDGQIVMIGDSVLSWNRLRGASVGDVLADELGVPVANLSTLSARISHPGRPGEILEIPAQLPDRPLDWIVVNGGANDLYFECLCFKCDRAIDRLIDHDGQGELPDFLTDLAQTGAQVVYVGYHRSRGLGGPYERCSKHLDVVETRLQSFGSGQDNIHVIDNKDIFPPQSTDHYAFDRIHPSKLGSATIAARLAQRMKALGYPAQP